MNDRQLLLVIVIGLGCIIYKYSNFKADEFQASLRMNVLIFFAIGIFAVYRNGGPTLELANKSIHMIDDVMNFSKTIGQLISGDGYVYNKIPIHEQPIGFLLILHFAFCTFGLFFTRGTMRVSDIFWGFAHLGYAFLAVIVYVAQLVFFEKFSDTFHGLYGIYMLSTTFLCFAGLYSFFGVFSSIISVFAMISILSTGEGIVSLSGLFWNSIFDFMKIDDTLVKLSILFATTIASLWDTAIQRIAGDTKIYIKVTDCIAKFGNN